MYCWTDEKSAKKFIDLYISVLAYAAKETGSFVEFFNVTGQKAGMSTLEEMTEAVEALREPFHKVEGKEGEYLTDMLTAVETGLRLLKGESISYLEAARRILGLEMREIAPERRVRTEKEIRDMLTAEGYDQPKTAQKVKQWYLDNGLEPDDLPETARQYLALLQREMRKLIPVPESEGWGRLELVSGVTWAAFSQYEGHYITNMLMNRDSVWKKPLFIDTIAHELYPGHHTWYTRREQLFYEDKYPLEATVLGICCAEDLLFEGIPESGMHFMKIDDPAHETEGLDADLKHKIIIARKILEYTRIIEITACYNCHVKKQSREQIIEDMTAEGWMEKKVAERVYNYLSHPFNGLYYPSYYYGKWIITYAYDRVPEEKKDEFFRIAYDTPNSTRSFIHRIEDLTGEPFDPVTMAQN